MLTRATILHLTLLVPLTALWWPGPVHAQGATGVVRVAPSGTDQASCGSVATPCGSLQFAVDRFPLPGSGTVLVAAGTYTAPSGDQVLRVTRRQILIQGGFATDFGTSDPDANPVIIDGENARRGILADCTMGGDVCHLALIGLTLRNGSAPVDPGTLNAFGGALDAFMTSVLLLDVEVTNNSARGLDSATGVPGDGAGGGLSFRQSEGFLSRVNFVGNLARGGDGGAQAFRGGLGVGGGVFAFESTVTMNHITATGNMAIAGDAPMSFGNSGGQRADGLGGFWALIEGSGAASQLTAVGNRAEGGAALNEGGLGLGGAIFLQEVPWSSLHWIDLRGNVALGDGESSLGGGGGIFVEDGSLHIDGGTITENLAQGGDATTNGGTGGGGGIYMNSRLPADVELDATNLVVAKNRAVAGSGGANRFAFGGGLFFQCPLGPGICDPLTASNHATLSHVTIADNEVTNGDFNQGTAIYVSEEASVDVAYSIVSGHTTAPVPGFDRGEAVLTKGVINFTSTLWDDNTDTSAVGCGGGSVSCFEVPPDGSFSSTGDRSGAPNYVAPTADPPDYHLMANSAAVDQGAGSPVARDFDQEARPFVPAMGMAIPDLGADEQTPMINPVQPTEGLFATIDERGTLLHLDAATGAAHPVGSGPVGLVGLTARQGRLFGLWEADQWIEFDPATGVALSASRPGIGAGIEGAVAISPVGTGFAVRGDPPVALWSFDPAGGDAVQLSADLLVGFDGLAFEGSGALFGLSQNLSLYDVGTSGTSLTFIGDTGLIGVGAAGLTFDDAGTLYAAVGDTLYTLNPATGASALVGATGQVPSGAAISGLAFVPEPGFRLAGLAVVASLAGWSLVRSRFV